MSMYADLVDTIKRTKDKCNLSDNQAVDLFIEIMGCMQWDIDGADVNSDNWEDQERKAAKKVLGLR